MMKSFREKNFKWLILLILLCVSAGFGYSLIAKLRAPSLVSVETLKEGPVSLVLALNGRIEPHHRVDVSAAVTAYVTEVLVSEGDHVKANAPLVVLESGLVQAQFAQAEAALAVQKAKRDQAAAAAKRADTLDGSAISRSDREAAETALATAMGEVERLTAALQEVNRQVERYTLRAPMDGVILSKSVEVGQLLDPQDVALVVAKPDDPFVETDVDELYAGRIAVGQKALLRPVGMEATMEGEVAFIAPRIDPSTGGRKVKLRFAAAPQGLPFGLTVNSNIIVQEYQDRITLPRSSLTDAGTVFIVENGQLVEKRPDYVEWPADRLMLRAGLAPGEQIVIHPSTLRAGEKVTLKQ